MSKIYEENEKNRVVIGAFAEMLAAILAPEFKDMGRTVEVKSTTKNNGVVLTGLIFPLIKTTKSTDVSPIIYVDEIFERYSRIHGANGTNETHNTAEEDINNICKEIVYVFNKGMNGFNKTAVEKDLSDFANVKDSICFKLVNAESNENVPGEPFMDMKMVFYIFLGTDISIRNDVGSILITKELLEKWGKSTKELLALAIRNTPKLLPATFSKMAFNGFSMSEIPIDLKSASHCSETDFGDPEDFSLFIISNKGKLNGAAAIAYPGFLEKVAKWFNADLYILPSSVHETIIMPKMMMFSEADPEDLQTMVKEVNAEEVAPDEILSNSVYFYDKTDKILMRLK